MYRLIKITSTRTLLETGGASRHESTGRVYFWELKLLVVILIKIRCVYSGDVWTNIMPKCFLKKLQWNKCVNSESTYVD